jgi:hypothetical protein
MKSYVNVVQIYIEFHTNSVVVPSGFHMKKQIRRKYSIKLIFVKNWFGTLPINTCTFNNSSA